MPNKRCQRVCQRVTSYKTLAENCPKRIIYHCSDKGTKYSNDRNVIDAICIKRTGIGDTEGFKPRTRKNRLDRLDRNGTLKTTRQNTEC